MIHVFCAVCSVLGLVDRFVYFFCIFIRFLLICLLTESWRLFVSSMCVLISISMLVISCLISLVLCALGLVPFSPVSLSVIVSAVFVPVAYSLIILCVYKFSSFFIAFCCVLPLAVCPLGFLMTRWSLVKPWNFLWLPPCHSSKPFVISTICNSCFVALQ